MNNNQVNNDTFFLKPETGFGKRFIICQFSVETCLFLELDAGVVFPFDPMGLQAKG